MKQSLTISFILLPAVVGALFAQGGYAGSVLLNDATPAEAGSNGILNLVSGGSSLIFGNQAALRSIDGHRVSLGFGFLPSPQSSFQASFAATVQSDAAIGVGVQGYSVSDISRRNAAGRDLGSFSSSDLAVTAGGSVGLGPGSIGAGIRYLRYDLDGIDAGTHGVTFGLSGTISLQERITFGVAVNNIAGTVSALYRDGLNERIPVDARLSAAYHIPFEERSEIVRSDPSGVLNRKSLEARTYCLLLGEVRAVETDDAPLAGIGFELVPLLVGPNSAVGFRGGVNVEGDFAFGFFLETPLDFGESPRISFAARRHSERGDLALHAGLDFGL